MFDTEAYSLNESGLNKLNGLFVYPCVPIEQLFNSRLSPDGLNEPWFALKEAFNKEGIQLIGLDEYSGQKISFELHLNVQSFFSDRSIPKFVILAENPLVHLVNGYRFLLSRYKKVFTWRSDIDLEQAERIYLPHHLRILSDFSGYEQRPYLLVLINSNKALSWFFPKKDLYRERFRAIRWFESFAPQDFCLYGHGWDYSFRQPVIGEFIHFIEGFLKRFRVIGSRSVFPSWRGVISRKSDVLSKARFSIVYENAIFNGYISEKIFDSFCCGNVPVYLGAPDVTDYIPKDCFIDKRDFSSYDDLYLFLKTMPEKRYKQYQQAIWDFLHSPLAELFSISNFTKTIVYNILSILSSSQAQRIFKMK